MAPPLQRFGGYQSHASNLPPPSMGGNPAFMNPSSTINPFANGNALSLGQGFGSGGGGLGGGSGHGFLSHEVQTRFHNANQQAHLNEQPGVRDMIRPRIRQVWKTNLEDEMKLIRAFIDYYPYISMDIEFPGLVARPMGTFRNKADYHYQCIRTNVDLLNVIQVGITLFSEDGEIIPPHRLPPHVESGLQNVPGLQSYRNNNAQLPCTWQFNFKFSLKDDMYSEQSINMLKMAGVDFDLLEVNGIEPFDFGAKLVDSGLVCDEEKHWVSFHGGYDFGYLTKLLHPLPLPDDELEFDKIRKKFFPSVWDVKYLMKDAVKLYQLGQLGSQDPVRNEIMTKFDQQKSLEGVGEALKIKRVGSAHQAGSDALHTGKCFFAVKEKVFLNEIPAELNGKVWGLTIPVYNDSSSFSIPHSTPQHYHQQLQENTTPGSNGAYVPHSAGTPSTPNTAQVGLATTPGPSNNSGMAPLTPGGGGGVFGNFQYAK